MHQSLTKQYPGLCEDVAAVMEKDSCVEKWTSEGFGDDKTKIQEFQESILRYMRENIALINIYLKEPYCELIKIDEFQST